MGRGLALALLLAIREAGGELAAVDGSVAYDLPDRLSGLVPAVARNKPALLAILERPPANAGCAEVGCPYWQRRAAAPPRSGCFVGYEPAEVWSAGPCRLWLWRALTDAGIDVEVLLGNGEDTGDESPPADACWTCRAQAWWRRAARDGGGWICGACHPAPRELERGTGGGQRKPRGE